MKNVCSCSCLIQMERCFFSHWCKTRRTSHAVCWHVVYLSDQTSWSRSASCCIRRLSPDSCWRRSSRTPTPCLCWALTTSYRWKHTQPSSALQELWNSERWLEKLSLVLEWNVVFSIHKVAGTEPLSPKTLGLTCMLQRFNLDAFVFFLQWNERSCN